MDDAPATGEPEHEHAEGDAPNDADIRALVRRLSRADAKGGAVIERAAIMAEGMPLDAVVEWIVAHDGEPEARPAPKGSGRGLHAARMSAATSVDRPPLRYVLPAAALTDPV